MANWNVYAPIEGWAAFTESAALTSFLWDHLTRPEWIYINLTSGSSIWESRLDASVVQVHYADGKGEQIIELNTKPGIANDIICGIAEQFRLVCSNQDL